MARDNPTDITTDASTDTDTETTDNDTTSDPSTDTTTSNESTAGRARAAARRVADEIRDLGSATQDVPDPGTSVEAQPDTSEQSQTTADSASGSTQSPAGSTSSLNRPAAQATVDSGRSDTDTTPAPPDSSPASETGTSPPTDVSSPAIDAGGDSGDQTIDDSFNPDDAPTNTESESSDTQQSSPVQNAPAPTTDAGSPSTPRQQESAQRVDDSFTDPADSTSSESPQSDAETDGMDSGAPDLEEPQDENDFSDNTDDSPESAPRSSGEPKVQPEFEQSESESESESESSSSQTSSDEQSPTDQVEVVDSNTSNQGIEASPPSENTGGEDDFELSREIRLAGPEAEDSARDLQQQVVESTPGVDSREAVDVDVEDGQLVASLNQSGERQRARALEEEFIKSTEGVDSRDETRVVETDDGRVQVELTSQGDGAIDEYQRDQITEEVIAENPGVDEASDIDITQRGDEYQVELSQSGREDIRGERQEAAREDITEQVLAQNAALSSADQVNISNLERTDDGITADIALTESGRDAVRERQAEAVDRFGDWYQEEQREQAQRDAARRREQLVEELEGSQFAREQFTRELADRTGRDPNDIKLDTSGDDVAIEFTAGGERRAVIEQVTSNSELEADEVTTTTDDGQINVELTDEELIERAAEQNDNVDEDDLQIVEQDTYEGDRELFDAAGEDRPDEYGRQVQLTDEGRAELRLQQAEEQNPNADFELVEGDNGEQRVERVEEFDDGGRFLGIGGAEDDVEAVADVSTEFLDGVGEGAGTVVGVPADIASSQVGLTESGEIVSVTQDLGRGAAQLANVPELLVTADEAGEFAGAGLAAGANSVRNGNLDAISEFSDDTVRAGSFLGGQVADQARENPVETGALVVGSLAGSVGAFRLAGSASSTSGQVARGVIQPGEEALALAGARPSSVARGIATGTARGIRNVSPPSIRSINTASLREARARAPSVRIGRGEGAIDIGSGVRGSTADALDAVTPSTRRSLDGTNSNTSSSLSDRIELARDRFSDAATRLSLAGEARVAAAREAVTDFDIETATSRPDADSLNVRDEISGRVRGAQLSAEAAAFNARRRVAAAADPDVSVPSSSQVRDQVAGAVRGGAVSSEAALFNARQRLSDATNIESSRPSPPNVRENVRGLLQGGLISGEAGFFNARRSLSDLDRGNVTPSTSGARDRVSGLLQGGRLSAEASVFNARRALADLEVSDVTPTGPDSGVRDVTDLRLEVRRGRPPRNDRTIDASELDIDASDLDTDIPTIRPDVESSSTNNDIEASSRSSQTGSGQLTRLESADAPTQASRAETETSTRSLNREVEASLTEQAQQPEVTPTEDLSVGRFDSSTERPKLPQVGRQSPPQPSVIEPSVQNELGTGSELGFNSSIGPASRLGGDSAFETSFDTSQIGDLTTGVDTGVGTSPAVDTGIESTLGVRSETTIDVTADVDTRAETNPEFRPPFDFGNSESGNPSNSTTAFEAEEDVFGTGFRDFDAGSF